MREYHDCSVWKITHTTPLLNLWNALYLWESRVMQSHTPRKHTAGWAALKSISMAKIWVTPPQPCSNKHLTFELPCMTITSKLVGVFKDGYIRLVAVGGLQSTVISRQTRCSKTTRARKSADSKTSKLSPCCILKNYPNLLNLFLKETHEL